MVTEVELENPNGTFSFTRTGSNWTASPSWSTFDGTKVDDLLRPFRNFNAEGLGATDADTGLDDAVKNGGIVTFKLKEGSPIKIRVGKSAGEKARYAAMEGDSTVYTIGDWASGWVLADKAKFSK